MDQLPVHARAQQLRQREVIGAHPWIVGAERARDQRPHRAVENLDAAQRVGVGAGLDVPAEQRRQVAQRAALVVERRFDPVGGSVAVPEGVESAPGFVRAAGDEAVPAQQGADGAARGAADRHQHRRVGTGIQARFMVGGAASGVGQRQVVEFAQQYRQHAAGEGRMTAAALAGNRYVLGCHRRPPSTLSTLGRPRAAAFQGESAWFPTFS